MPSVVDICNRGLQRLGADRITSITEDSPNARDCNSLYEMVRDAELRAHPWSFAVKRASLPKDAVTLTGAYANQYTFPADMLRLLPGDIAYNDIDYKIEGRTVITHEGAPLKIRYVAAVSDTGLFDSLFVEALSARIAVELNEKITQSNSKGTQAREDYKQAIRVARQANAFEKLPTEQPEDTWLSIRA